VVDQFAAALVKMIRHELNNRADDLASGKAQSMEGYRESCGFIRGLAQAEEWIKDLAKKVETGDE
jgi:hypothetical protein